MWVAVDAAAPEFLGGQGNCVFSIWLGYLPRGRGDCLAYQANYYQK